MAKTPTQIASLARSHTESAINVLAGIMTKSDSADTARVSAATALLDRGWGKPTQPHDGDGEGAAIRLELVRRIIVNSGGDNGST